MEHDVPQESSSGLPDSNNSQSPSPFPIVGIGASAGGVRALQDFFIHTPADSGMAFVVILHLSPIHESNMAHILGQVTTMEVEQVTEKVKVLPNQVYIIPPTKHLSMVDGHIEVHDPDNVRERRAPIDVFFRTLSTHGRNAAAIVLSGNGADGTSGLQRVKELGGVAIVQDPEEAEYSAMPRSAIATGLIDYVLPSAAIPERLIAYWRNAEIMQLPAVEKVAGDDLTDLLREIFVLMRSRTGHDFSQYKRPTLLRRIGRRMQVNGVTTMPAYLQVLRSNPDEVQSLLRDLLISVTNFFRDQEAWIAVEGIITQLFLHKDPDDQVRVWVAGCATGEEAYTVAMLLYEYASRLEQPPAIQVFATDIDEDAIAVARLGSYPETIAADITQERLSRFFLSDQGRYQIKKEIRDLVLFADHNLLRDPPFSRLDLITCRNLLIYLNRDVQEQVLQLFQFTLRPNGYLLLGASESTDGVPGLFAPVDKGQRLFQRRTLPVAMTMNMPPLPLSAPPRRHMVGTRPPVDPATHSLIELHQQLLAQFTPPSVIVNEDYDIIHLSRGVGRFLQYGEGEPSHNLLKVVHPLLRIELRTALFSATRQSNRAETRRVRVDLHGSMRLVNLLVQPLNEPDWARGYIMVVFNDIADPNEIEPVVASDTEPMVRQLEDELQRTKEQLRTTIEQYETAVEEYKAANEELQAINEELRAATEELETSKEELQSVNEELTTVNQELKYKVEEVGQTNNDLQNLMASTEIGTIFVNREIRIKRYTPSAQAIFNLIASDVNRPLAHITHSLQYDQLPADATRVLETLAVTTREIESKQGHWYLVRLLPYRTVEDKIDGVILTFVDITDRRHAEELMRESELRLRLLVENVQDYAIMSLTPEGRIESWNTGAERMFGYHAADVIGQPDAMLFSPGERSANQSARELQLASESGRAESEGSYLRKDGSHFYASAILTLVAGGRTRSFVKVMRDLTQQQQAEAAVRQSHDDQNRQTVDRVEASERRLAEQTEVAAEVQANEQWLTAVLQQMPLGVLVADRSGQLVFSNQQAEAIFGAIYPGSQQTIDTGVLQPFTHERQPYEHNRLPMARSLLQGEVIRHEEVWFPRNDGTWLLCRVHTAPIRDTNEQITGVVIVCDETNGSSDDEAA